MKSAKEALRYSVALGPQDTDLQALTKCGSRACLL